MIARIRGEVVDTIGQSAVIEVGGIGYLVQLASRETLSLVIGNEVTVYTHFHVRENAQELFGFLEREALGLFEQLISVSGVGPKVALAILDLGEAETIRNEIARGNTAFVAGASGVGKRLAERLIVDLSDKVGPAGVGGNTVNSVAPGDEAHAALVALGYSGQQAAQALASVDSKLSVEDRIRAALKDIQ